ncbi:MAG: 3'-5' exonuclease, partial [Akkermansia sp.]
YRSALLKLSPLGPCILPPHTAAAGAADIDARGYTATLHSLLSALEPAERSHTAQEWLQAAQRFDAMGGTPEEWVRFIRNMSYTAIAPRHSVQIMTMHKSKGLEFDAVILPMISQDAWDNTRHLDYLTTPATDPQAVLLPPKSSVRREIQSVADAEAHWQAQQRAQEYNLLYVALTRAKQALYCLLNGDAKTVDAQKKPKMTSTALLLRAMGFSGTIQREHPDQTETMFERGTPTWWQHARAAATGSTSAPTTTPRGLKAGLWQRRKLTPSALHEAAAPAPAVPSAAGRDAAAFGTAVHACFEQVEWLREGEEPALAGQPEKARELVRAALGEPSVRALFTRPASPCTVLNEQPLEAVMPDGSWLSGTIDRLVLHGADAACTRFCAADIIDYKTDHADAPELFRRHREQMRAYRRLIAAAFELPLAQVRVTLVSCPDNAAARVLPFPPELLD